MLLKCVRLLRLIGGRADATGQPQQQRSDMARFTGMPLRPARFPGPAPTQPISRSSSHRSFSNRDSNQDFLPLCHVRLNVEFTINLFVLKSALVRNSKDVWSLNQCPTVPRCISRESKLAQMPILGCRSGWVPVGQFSLATLRGTRARTFLRILDVVREKMALN